MSGATARPGLGETWPDAKKAGAYSWAKAPRLGGKAVEVGALARQYVADDPLIGDLVVRANGSSVFGRVVARLLELAKTVLATESWVDDIRLKQPFCVSSAVPAEGAGTGLIEAARGALGHWLVVKDGAILRYQIIAPTTWNFSPRDQDGQAGPLEQALTGLDVGALGAKSPLVQHVVRSFDPCMVCTAH
jgi:hydrogenase large subunit